MWCLPMGFAKFNEDIEGAALRELAEEAGIKGRIVSLLDVRTSINCYYGNILVVSYVVECIGGELKAGDDAKDARFFPLDSLPELAFETNKKTIEKYKRLSIGL